MNEVDHQIGIISANFSIILRSVVSFYWLVGASIAGILVDKNDLSNEPVNIAVLDVNLPDMVYQNRALQTVFLMLPVQLLQQKAALAWLSNQTTEFN